jgi:hypothetical protein
MRRGLALLLALAMVVAAPVASLAAGPKTFTPGAPGAGDPYFPLDGNGGYDVSSYDLDVAYDPETGELTGRATITAHASQDLSAFNLDFVGLTVRSVTVDGRPATWVRDAGEMTVTPVRGIPSNKRFVVVVTYDGVPEPIGEGFGLSGFIHTADGALVVGQPHVAATWFPANDHPSDTAAFTFRITVPAGLEAIANGELIGTTTSGDTTTWEWRAKDPMATYLAGMAIGEFEIDAYRSGRVRYWDAIDVGLLGPTGVPRTGERFAISQAADASYKRLTREIEVPLEGATLSFWVDRETEEAWDFLFVEARTAGGSDWTTLQDETGHLSDETLAACFGILGNHPSLEHYLTFIPPEDPEDPESSPTCEPTGTTGDWFAASGASDGYEEWSFDLSAWAGETVEVSITYASDSIIQARGVFVDDIVVSTGEGSTSFEDDDDPLDGWTVPGEPAGSPPNANDWIVGTAADTPPGVGETARMSFARQPEIIAFLEESFGRYPFRFGGGIVDDAPIFFALENQTRPIYSPEFFTDPISGDFVVVHELAHQWYGDSLTIAEWQHIWLNEGFATYAEWLWAEREGFGSAQETFDFFYEIFGEEEFFWGVIIGDPGPDALFDFAVYARGAMTLHQLRLTVGDDAFFEILRRWAKENAGGHVTTDGFIALAERISRQDLDGLFHEWLFEPTRPEAISGVTARRQAQGGSGVRVPLAAASLGQRFPDQKERIFGQ